MQSQQKKVKWSRGETASALEERTDTGITEVSVARMENCMADIYGNISRRPALKLIPLADKFQTEQHITLPVMYAGSKYIPFYISEDDFILLAINGVNPITGYRIKNNKIIGARAISSAGTWLPSIDINTLKYAQQNNYMIVSSATGDIKITVTLQDNIWTFDLDVEPWVFTAGWYAPNGTNTKAVTANDIPGLQFNKDGLGFTPYAFTDINGESTVFYAIDTGLGIDKEEDVQEAFPAGSIIQFPKNGAYLRVEGFSTSPSNDGQADQLLFPDIVFDGVLNSNQSIPNVGYYVMSKIIDGLFRHKRITRYSNGQQVGDAIDVPHRAVVRNRASSTGYSITDSYTGDWSELTETNITIMVYGALLTPAANSQAKDETVNVEYGYVNLTPATGESFPSPAVVAFSDQRLWAAGWKIESTADQYALVIGSQIAKYTDFKNDYNLDNEAITLDILTKYKEDVLHLVDYNGLKIFTTGAEWAYVNGAPVKQSTNGSLRQCEPIVFGSLCLYADQTGGQIRAMQYEFQNNLFDSTVINQMTPGDLIWQPTAMAQYEDKTNNTGRHLFVLNSRNEGIPTIATSNFVPGNQAAIWSRWTFQSIIPQTISIDIPLIVAIVDTKRQPIFMVFCQEGNGLACMPAVLDYNANVDLESPVDSSYKYRIAYKNGWWNRFIPNATVAVYSNGVYQYETTTDNTGTLVRQPTGLSNVTVGMPINARVVSHPIDVGGKTKTVTKRIAKAVMSVRDTEPGAVTINSKTGYMNPAQDTINFYGVTGMKREIIYTITNNKGAKFTIESLTMNIEYGTLIS